MEKTSTFITQDNSFIIELSRKDSSLFQDINKSYKCFCILSFKNNIGTIIKQISMTDIEISILLDNIYFYLESGFDVNYYIKSHDTTGEEYIIQIFTELKEGGYKTNDCREFFKLSAYKNEVIVPVLQFDVSNTLPYLLNELYELCLEDSTDNNMKSLDPSFLL